MALTNEQIAAAIEEGVRSAMSAIRDTVEERNNLPESQSPLSDKYHPEKA